MTRIFDIGEQAPHFDKGVIIATCAWRDEPEEDFSLTAYLVVTRTFPSYHIMVINDESHDVDGEIYDYVNIVEAAADWSNICGVKAEATNF